MTHAGLVLTHLLVAVFLSPHPVEKKTPRVVHQERLIQSVSDETQEAWFGFLLNDGAEFSVRQGGMDFYVASGAIEILERAEKVEAIRDEARRALTERRLEHEVTRAWPQVKSAAVCLTPDGESQSGEGSAVFIVAPNFPIEDRDRLTALTVEQVPGLDAGRIQILGAVRSGASRDAGRLPHDPLVSVAQR